MSKIRLHGSSSGYMEIAPPAAGSSATVTLPNSAGEILLSDGSAASLTQIPAANIVGVCTSGLTKTGGFGKFLQVVQDTSHTRLDTTSTTYVASSHSITITPTAASSKILVNFTLIFNTNGSNHRGYVDIYRSINSGTFTGIAPVGSNETIGANNNSGFFGQIRGDNSRIQAPTHVHYLDSPSYSLGNSIVYKLYARSSNSSNTIEVPSSSNAEPVVMMLTEIAA